MFGSDRKIYNTLTENLEQGPRNKMPATCALEKIVYALLDKNNKTHCRYNNQNELEIQVNYSTYNLTQILKQHPDFEQLSLDDQVLDQYVDFMQQQPEEKVDRSLGIQNKNNFHFAEVIAIRWYTSNWFKVLNNFLRSYGGMLIDNNQPVLDMDTHVKKMLLTICVASHGLSRPIERKHTSIENSEEFTFKKLIRREQYVLALANERDYSVKTGQPIFSEGFTSTSSSKTNQWGMGNVDICISQLKNNPLAKSVKKVSVVPYELEYLFVPNTQFIFYKYKKDYSYHAIPVRPITNPTHAKAHTNFFQPAPLTEQQLTIIRIERLEKCFKQEFHNHLSVSQLAHQNTIREINHFMKAMKEGNFDHMHLDRLLGCLIFARDNADRNNIKKHLKFHAHSSFAAKLDNVVKNYLNESAIAGDKQTLSEELWLNTYCNDLSAHEYKKH